MSRATKRRQILESIEFEYPLDAPPKHVSVIVADLAIEVLSLHADDAAEYSDTESSLILAALRSRFAELTDVAGLLRFDFNSASEDHVQGSSFVQPDEEGTPRAAAKRRRLRYDEYVRFLKALKWYEFEACCRGVLRLLGCVDPILTSRGNDQGIDFHGQLSLEGRLDNFSELPGLDRNLKVWMVGQAKHYVRTQVSTPDLRELVGSVRLARSRVFADGGLALEKFQPRLLDPIFYLFFTTGAISSDGKKLLAQSGMVSMEGPQIAIFLSDNDVGVVDNAFDEHSAREWIQANS